MNPLIDEEIVSAYLERQLLEFQRGKEMLFRKLKFKNSIYSQFETIICILSPLIRYIAIYYLEEKTTVNKIKKEIQKEIRALLMTLERKKLDYSNMSEEEKEKRKSFLEYLADITPYYTMPIFLNFNDLKELEMILTAARQLAYEKNIYKTRIFSRDEYYNELLGGIYPHLQEQLLKIQFQNLFTVFSPEKIIERLMIPIAALYADDETTCQMRIKMKLEMENLKKHNRSAIIDAKIEEMIFERMKEVYY